MDVMRAFVVTPAAGKRLIGKALAVHPAVESALNDGTIVIIAGTTNGYVAEELLARIGSASGFSRARFFRGLSLPPGHSSPVGPPPATEGEFPGDVVLVKGVWEKGKTIFDVVERLQEGDLVLKGANALDLARGRAGVFVAHPKAGTIGAAVQAVVGRRVRLLVPVGLEKRIDGDLDSIAAALNAPGSQGPRLFPMPGEVFTEIDAISLLTGASAKLVGAGGACGAEGCSWIGIEGTGPVVAAAEKWIHSVMSEPPFTL
jgi:hypothetical protein